MTERDEQMDKSQFAASAVARLYSGSLTAEEQRQIEEWLKADEANRAEYESILFIWDQCDDLGKDVEVAESILWKSATPADRKHPPGARFWLAASVVGLAVISAYALLNPFGETEQYQVFETGIGQQIEVDLVDGSVLILNTDTQLLVDFDSSKRRIAMQRGEAFFDIRKDPLRPLTVIAGDQAVTVLGTKFNVRWSGANVTVAVIDGSVAVHPVAGLPDSPALERAGDRPLPTAPAPMPQAEVLLDTGSIGVFSPASEPVVDHTRAKVADIPNWRHGFVRFENVPLYQVIAEINRYTKTKIVIEDKAVMDLRLTGAFRPTEVQAVLDGLQETLPIRVIAEFQRYVIVGDSDLHKT